MFNKARLLGVAALFSLYMVGFAIPYSHTWAQDETPTPTEVVEASPTPDPTLTGEQTTEPTAEATQVVIIVITPTGPVATETADTPENPRGGLSVQDFIEFLKPIGVIVGLMILALFGAALYFAYQQIPSWIRPIIKQAVAGAVHSGFDMLDESARKTTDTDYDDKLYGKGRQDFDKWLEGLDAKVDQKLESIAQRVSSRSVTIGSPNAPPSAVYPGDLMPPDNMGSGQGLVEYALILVLVAVVVIVILALLGPTVGNIFSNLVHNL